MSKWLLIPLMILALGVIAAAVVWAVANATYRARMAEAEAAWVDIAGRAQATTDVYSPDLVADLPEIARRYFNHAIAPGTLLASTVELKMGGQFLLGASDKPQTFSMTARQILRPPEEFIWIAEMRSGPIMVSGTDALYQSHAWMRFFMFWAIPLVEIAATEGLDRSAAVRPALEAIWAPASLLPRNGATWEQIAPDQARITFGPGRAVEMTMTLAPDGRVIDIVAPRWSDANLEHEYRLQPFGGTVEAERRFGGFTIPSVVHVGNFYGTDDYFAFFKANITDARYY